MLELVALTDPEFDEYLSRSLEEYVREGMRATSMTPEQAEEFAHQQLATLLPDGNRTKGQHFCKLRDAEGTEVGDLWFAEQLEEIPPRVFLYDIRIREDQRGRGLGSLAMRTLEHEARQLGAREILLSVFSHNTDAIHLYDRLGYEVDVSGAGGQRMKKSL